MPSSNQINPFNYNIDKIEKKASLFDKPYFQNYLIMFGGENPNIIDEEAVYDADFLGLKNYQTPEYDYTDATLYVQENRYIRRLYWQIFTGTNQEKGLDNVYLGYTSDTSASDSSVQLPSTLILTILGPIAFEKINELM